MASSTAYCSLNPFPRPPISIPTPASRTTEIACVTKQRSWKNRCLLGLTCVIIGLESSNFVAIGDQEIDIASMNIHMQAAGSKIVKWSDERACQPWRLNSLETIVPENLPRPSTRRRWESTGFSTVAPSVNVAAKSGAKSCFLL